MPALHVLSIVIPGFSTHDSYRSESKSVPYRDAKTILY